jgi:hypothetical protein
LDSESHQIPDVIAINIRGHFSLKLAIQHLVRIRLRKSISSGEQKMNQKESAIRRRFVPSLFRIWKIRVEMRVASPICIVSCLCTLAFALPRGHVCCAG